MAVLVTGLAGFIGFHVGRALLARGETIIGIDNLNDYYDPALKRARLEQLGDGPSLHFYQADIADRQSVARIFDNHPDIDRVVNLAAQAGVRYSLENPYCYVDANVMGQLTLLESARQLPHLQHFVYASSSAVYGANTKLPFSTADAVDDPVSLYAATKRSAELMARTYARLYGIPATGLRYFTVYGPWGRPDMAAFIFTRRIFQGEPIDVFNEGKMRRDFTYIDDIVDGTLAALDRVPQKVDGQPPEALYNLGNHRAEDLMEFIGVLESAIGKKAELHLQPMQKGDVEATFADIEQSRRDLGFAPVTPIGEGIPRFVAWYRDYFKV